MHSSFREGGSWTILEAMAHGVPVICQDRAGMKDLVTDKCGFRIAAKKPDELTDGIANSLGRLYSNPTLTGKMGTAGQYRIRNTYTWTNVAERICNIKETLDGHETKSAY